MEDRLSNSSENVPDHWRLGDLLASTDVGIWFCDLPFNVLNWDTKVKEHFWLSPDALVTIDTFYQRLHPEDRERTRQAIEASIGSRCHYDIEYRTVSNDGQIRWVRAIGRAFYGGSGEPVRFDGVTVDITAQKNREAELSAARRDLASVLDRVSDGIATLDSNWEFIYVNAAGARQAGRRSPQDLIGKNIWQICPELLGTDFERGIRRVMETRQNASIRSYYQPLDKWFSADIYPDPNGITVYYKDVTGSKTAEQSRAQLRAALEASDTGTFFWNIQGNELNWDESLDRLFGLPKGETVRTLESFLNCIHPDDRSGVLENCRRCITEGADFDMEFRVVWPDGSTHWLYDRGKTFLDASGQPASMMGACVDISDRKRSEGLLEERARISALGADIGVALTRSGDLTDALRSCTDAIVKHLDAAFARIWTVSNDGRTLELQASSGIYTHIDGAHSRVPIGKFKIGLIAEERLPHLTNDVLHDDRVSDPDWARREGMVAFAGYPLLIGDRAVGVIAAFARHKFGQDAVRALASIANSLALGIERAHNETALQQAKEAAESASRAKSEFLASMSHELRTPLNAIIGYGEMLQEEAEELGAEALIPDLRKVYTAGKHLLSLINDILDLSKIEAGRMELFVEAFSVRTLVEEAIHVAQALAERNGNSVRFFVPDNAGLMRSDQTKVRQSLLNLLSNAAKFTQNGAIELRVELDNQPPDDFVVFRVTDTGIGLTDEQIEKLFQSFQQADNSVSRRYGGSGLGLALTQRFCQMMGGTISVASTFGKGSEFIIRLPRQIAGQEAASVSDSYAAPGLPFNDAKGTVLIIDDDPTACDIIGRFVAKEGYRAVSALNGQDGLRKAREIRPNLITLDVMMPSMDGWAVLNALKRDPDLKDIPVVMLTMVDNRNLGYALGASDYLTKPVEREQLASVLRKHSSGARPCYSLIVDDDADARSLLRQMLEREGWVVSEAGNGEDGLKAMRNRVPALVLLDLMMPGIDGFAFARELQQNPDWCNTPIVVLTAKDLTEEDRMRLNGKVERILSKSALTREELFRELQRSVQNCRTRGPQA